MYIHTRKNAALLVMVCCLLALIIFTVKRIFVEFSDNGSFQ